MRPKRVRYPNARYVHYTYGVWNGLDEAIGRVAAIQDDSGGSPGTTVASYKHDGAGRIVVEDYKDAKVHLDLWGQTSGIYAGFDRFGRVKQQWWHDYDGGGADIVKHTYGYDRNSNRRWKADAVATGASKKLDELYAYGNLNRLVGFKRGKLNQGKTDIPTTNHDRLRGVQWGLSDVGNWTEYGVDVKADGGGNYADGDYEETGDLDQDRKHNKANEIYDETAGNAITEEEGQVAWADPARDARGNMTTVTRPSSPTGTYTCTYDAWNRLMYLACEGTLLLFRYDGLHRQICKIVADGTNWDRTDYYHTAGWQVVEERFTDGAELIPGRPYKATNPGVPREPASRDPLHLSGLSRPSEATRRDEGKLCLRATRGRAYLGRTPQPDQRER